MTAVYPPCGANVVTQGGPKDAAWAHSASSTVKSGPHLANRWFHAVDPESFGFGARKS
jgi:hypothetical protein